MIIYQEYYLLTQNKIWEVASFFNKVNIIEKNNNLNKKKLCLDIS